MAMKRGYTALEYKSVIRRLRAVRPDISLSTDFIVGFPGETDDDFDKLMKLATDLEFDASFSFIYSSRPGTPAASLEDGTPHEVKLKRLQTLQAYLESNVQRFQPGHGGFHPDHSGGRPQPQRPQRADGAHRVQPDRELCTRPHPERLIGQLISVNITQAYPHSLRAEVKVV